MTSLFDDLSAKLDREPRLTKRSGARADLALLMFNSRDVVRDLWEAAASEVIEARHGAREPSALLEAAVEELRPIFGERSA